MGYSISADTARRLDRNRRNGRLCVGGNRYCTTPATKVISTTSYPVTYGQGTPSTGDMLMCGRHAKPYHAGFAGINFRVNSVTLLGSAPAVPQPICCQRYGAGHQAAFSVQGCPSYGQQPYTGRHRARSAQLALVEG